MKMDLQNLSDEEILNGIRNGYSEIIREYFYGYCKVGYCIFDQRYQLSKKDNLDFMSLAHQYAIYLIEHDWKPLEVRSPNVTLKTWLINGFRYVVLDALKWYRKEYGSITYKDYLCSFDMTSDLRLQFNRMLKDVCDHMLMSREDKKVIEMFLLEGFKVKEIASHMGLTPSAISQKITKLKEGIIIPYFRENFDIELEMHEVKDSYLFDDIDDDSIDFSSITDREIELNSRCVVTDFITKLRPDEIFVFGSNLKGIHYSGAASDAYRKFGAIMGHGVGLQGQSYGIPTMQGGVETIRPYVDEFIQFAKEHPDMTFLVTRIGCGMAGFTEDEISPLFKKAYYVDNIVLPEGWRIDGLNS